MVATVKLDPCSSQRRKLHRLNTSSILTLSLAAHTISRSPRRDVAVKDDIRSDSLVYWYDVWLFQRRRHGCLLMWSSSNLQQFMLVRYNSVEKCNCKEYKNSGNCEKI